MFDVCDKNKYLGPVVKSVLVQSGFDADLEEVDHQTYFIVDILRS